MSFSVEDVKNLRTRTGAGMMDCKNALVETNGDVEKALEILREKGIAQAAKKATRIASQGIVDSYIHMGGKIGVLLEVNCETDFVAKGDMFKELVHDIALQIAASKPVYISRDDISETEVEYETNIAKAQIANDPLLAKKPDHIKEKMIVGMMEKYFKDMCLMEQSFVKNPEVTIFDLVLSVTARIGKGFR